MILPCSQWSGLQDVVKRARAPLAHCALLRIRTGPDLRVTSAHGKLQQDPDHEQLWHMVASDAHETVTVGLELASSKGLLARQGERPPQPVIQVCFALGSQ